MPATASPLSKTIKVPQVLQRAAKLERGEDGKFDWMSIASDRPYLRYDWWNDEYYYEVLSHKPDGIDTERLQSGLPVCFNHNTNQQLATAGSWKIENGKLSLKYDEFKWTAGEFTQNKRADMESGALPHTSVSYELLGEGICTGAKDNYPIYEFRWKPYEGGPVVIPADASVGPGRSRENAPTENPREINIRNIDNAQKPDNTQPTKENSNPTQMKTSPLVRQHFMAPDNDNPGGNNGTATIVDVKAERGNAVAEYRARCEKIDAHVDSMKDTYPAWYETAKTVAKKHKAGEANFEQYVAEVLPLCKFTQPEGQQQLGREGDQLSGGQPQQRFALSPGAQMIQSKQFKAAVRNGKLLAPVSVETDISVLGLRGKMVLAQRGVQFSQQLGQRAGFTSSDLSGINLQIIPSLIELGQQRLTVMDLLAPGTTSAAAIKYPMELTLGRVEGVLQTDGKPYAGMVAERGLKPNWEPDLTVETANVKKIAITAKVPDEFLQDFPGFQSYLDGRLPFMVDMRAEQQMLYGDGLGDNIKGLMTFQGTLTRAYATNWSESLKKAITDVEVASFFPVDGIIMHPYDWEVASLEKDGEDRYIAGGPIYIQLGNGMYAEIRTYWGKPVVVTTAATVGQPIVGCFKLGAQYFLRSGMEMASTNANEDDFRRNLICVRAEERLALCNYRPTCFLEVTGGPART